MIAICAFRRLCKVLILCFSKITIWTCVKKRDFDSIRETFRKCMWSLSEKTGWDTGSCQQLWWYITSIAKGSVSESMKSMSVVMGVRISLSFDNMVWGSKDYHAQSEEIRCTLEDLRFACFLSGLVPNTFRLIVNNTVTTSTFRWWRWETIIGYGCATVKTTFSILLNGYSSPFD